MYFRPRTTVSPMKTTASKINPIGQMIHIELLAVVVPWLGMGEGTMNAPVVGASGKLVEVGAGAKVGTRVMVGVRVGTGVSVGVAVGQPPAFARDRVEVHTCSRHGAMVVYYVNTLLSQFDARMER